MRRRFISRFLLPAVAALPLAAAAAPPALADGAFIAAQKAFIRDLFRAGRHFDTIAETRRLLHHEPGLPGRGDFEYFIAVNYFLGGQYASAAANLPGGGSGPRALRGIVLRSQALARRGEWREALAALDQVPEEGIAPELRRGVLARKAELMLRQGRYADIAREIERQRSFFADARALDPFHADIMRYRELRTRSAGLAMALSAALPGAGQAYAGRYLDGLISLAAVAASALGARRLYLEGERPAAYTLAFFSALFYAGGVYAAGNAAAAATAAERERFEGMISERHIPPYDPLKTLDLQGVLP